MSDSPIKRRDALKVIATSTAAIPLTGLGAAEPSARALPVLPDAPVVVAEEAAPAPLTGPRGTPSDPDLLRPKITWSMKLTVAELATLSALCDMIIPADSTSPSASAVGVPAYINEYVSAPYPGNQRTLVQVRGGLTWLDVECQKRFGHAFARCTIAQKAQVCDDICSGAKAKPEFSAASRFFDRVRDLCAEGFYTTDAGMKDVGYVGNMALPKWDPPPPAVLKHLGLA